MNRQFREIRIKKNMSVETLADLSGVHFNTIKGFENGKLNTGYKNIMLLAQVLGCTIQVENVTDKTVFHKYLKGIPAEIETTNDNLYMGC